MEHLHQDERIAAAISDIFYDAMIAKYESGQLSVVVDKKGTKWPNGGDKVYEAAKFYSEAFTKIVGASVTIDALMEDWAERTWGRHQDWDKPEGYDYMGCAPKPSEFTTISSDEECSS